MTGWRWRGEYITLFRMPFTPHPIPLSINPTHRRSRAACARHKALCPITRDGLVYVCAWRPHFPLLAETTRRGNRPVHVTFIEIFLHNTLDNFESTLARVYKYICARRDDERISSAFIWLALSYSPGDSLEYTGILYFNPVWCIFN